MLISHFDVGPMIHWYQQSSGSWSPQLKGCVYILPASYTYFVVSYRKRVMTTSKHKHNEKSNLKVFFYACLWQVLTRARNRKFANGEMETLLANKLWCSERRTYVTAVDADYYFKNKLKSLISSCRVIPLPGRPLDLFATSSSTAFYFTHVMLHYLYRHLSTWSKHISTVFFGFFLSNSAL